MLAGFFAMSMLIMRLFPETPLARSLHRWLVEWPLDMVPRIERRHVFAILILLSAGQTLALIGGTELAFIYALDVSVYADAMLLGYLATTATRLRSSWWVVRSAAARIVARLPKPRPRSRRKKPAAPRRVTPVNDDDPVAIPMACAA